MDENEKEPLIQTKDKFTSKDLITFILIQIVELFERMTYFSIYASLLFLFVQFFPHDAPSYLLLWISVSFICPIFWAYLSDTVFGRFKTILISVIVYLFGMTLLAGSQFFINQENRSYLGVLSLIGLFIIAISSGGIRSNVSPFGADQFYRFTNKEKYQRSFFLWYYFSTNIGGTIALTIGAYVSQYYGLRYGLLIPFFGLVLSVFLYILGSPLYVKLKPKGSIMTIIVVVYFKCLFAPTGIRELTHTFLDRALYYTDKFGKQIYDQNTVDDIKKLTKMLPVIFVLLFYAIFFISLGPVHQKLAIVMDLTFLPGIQFPLTFGGTALNLAAMLFATIFDHLIPFMKNHGIKFGHFKRIGWGIVLGGFSLTYFVVMEAYRRYLVNAGDTIVQEYDAVSYVVAANLSVWYLVPGKVILGASEILFLATTMEFCYEQAPISMKSFAVALYFFNYGFGSLVAIFFNYLFNLFSVLVSNQVWLGNNYNDEGTHIDYYHCYLMILIIIGILLFWLAARSYKFHKQQEIQEVNKNVNDKSKNN